MAQRSRPSCRISRQAGADRTPWDVRGAHSAARRFVAFVLLYQIIACCTTFWSSVDIAACPEKHFQDNVLQLRDLVKETSPLTKLVETPLKSI